MAAGVLTDGERGGFVGKVAAKKWLKLGEIEFLSFSNGRRLVLKNGHIFLASLSIGQQSGIVQVLKGIEGAQRKTIAGE